ncbi:hypothetical protein J6590_025894 [Homalodisca vitripennis]|nr:hypothetical protein J6590_025894 [Homalodisca vitripennis]
MVTISLVTLKFRSQQLADLLETVNRPFYRMQFLAGMWIVALGFTVVLSAPADQNSAVQVPDAPAADVGLAPEVVKSTDVSDETSLKSSNDFSAIDVQPNIVLTPDGNLKAEVIVPVSSLKSGIQGNTTKSTQLISQLIVNLLKVPINVITTVVESIFNGIPATQAGGQVTVTQTSPAVAKT